MLIDAGTLNRIRTGGATSGIAWAGSLAGANLCAVLVQRRCDSIMQAQRSCSTVWPLPSYGHSNWPETSRKSARHLTWTGVWRVLSVLGIRRTAQSPALRHSQRRQIPFLPPQSTSPLSFVTANSSTTSHLPTLQLTHERDFQTLQCAGLQFSEPKHHKTPRIH